MAALTFSLTQQQYEALIALAREGTKDADGNVVQDKALRLDAFLKSIEKDNGITRHALWVRWQETDSPLPPTTNFPEVWPPLLTHYIELISRPIARADVDAVVAAKARRPLTVMVTKDPAALVGWTTLDDYFLTG